MFKIIAIEAMGAELAGYLETDSDYVAFHTSGDSVVLRHHYPKKDFKDLEHFVGVMSKFDPDTFFLDKPIKVPSLTYAAIKAASTDQP